MRRREFVLLFASATACPLATQAQQAGKVPRVGYLRLTSSSDRPPLLDAFRQGLREFGWIEGQNIVIDYRFAEGRLDRLPDLAAELVRLKVDVIVSLGTQGATAARKATETIPIVMIAVRDPVGIGLIASLARPGGNVTGVSGSPGLEIVTKQLELLKEAIPEIRQVAILSNPKERAGALLVLSDIIFNNYQTELADLAARNRLPATYGVRESVEAGGLMSYGPSFLDFYRRSTAYVDKILNGAKPADLPVEQPTKFELVINLKTARALGLNIPPTLLARADEVLE